MKRMIFFTVLFGLVCIAAWILLMNSFKSHMEKIRDEEMKPDTTITCINGKCDTIIVTKPLPWYLK